MKKYSILTLALLLCLTGLTGCRRKMNVADGTIPNTTAATAATTHPTTMPTTVPTTIPATTENHPTTGTEATSDNATDATNPNTRSRSRSHMPGVG